MRPTISLCMIARNEQENLRPCLEPVRGLVDQIVVVDTGSTDRTAAVAAELGAEVYQFPWKDDFAAARNESLRHARGDWVFWLDADDRLDQECVRGLAELREVLDQRSADVYAFQVFSPSDSAGSSGAWVTHGRLFRRAAGLRWARRVHEELLPENPDPRRWPELAWSGLMIRHIGYKNPSRRRLKLYRDLRLLQLEHAVDPDDPVTLFYLGWTYLELGNSRQALRLLRRVKAEPPLQRKLTALRAQTLQSLHQTDEALRVCNEGLASFPDDPELLYLSGVLLGEMGQQAGAEQRLLRLVRIGPQHYYHLGVEHGLSTVKGPFMLGLLYHAQGRFAEAEQQFRFAIGNEPHSSEAWIGLGQLYLSIGHWTGLRDAIAHLRECPSGEIFAPVLEARWLIERQDFPAARRLLHEAIEQDPRLLWPRLVLSDLAMRGGMDRHTTIQVLRDILELDPAHAITRQRLEQLLAQEREPVRKGVVRPAPTFAYDASPARGSTVVIATR